MSTFTNLYAKIVGFLSSSFGESIGLLLVRIALAYPFWVSGRTKVVEGSLLTIDNTQYQLFADVFSGLPLSPQLAVPLTTYAEFFLPLMIIFGLGTRFAALGLLIMTLVIEIFVIDGAWWTVHIFWTALALVLISRGGGLFSLDRLFDRVFAAKAD